MARVRPFLLTLLFAFVVSVAYAASASAHAFIIEGKAIVKGEVVAAEGTSVGSSFMESEGFRTECKKSTSVDEFEFEGKSKSTISTKECKVLNDAGCKIVEPIVSHAKTELVIFKEKLAIKSTPASGEAFDTSSVSGCNHSELNGSWSLKGSQTSELPEAEVEAVEHKVVSKPSGSSLKESGRPGTFAAFLEAEGKTKLHSGKKWHSN